MDRETHYAKLEIFTTVTMKITIPGDVTLWGFVYLHFWETCCLHHLLWKWRQEVPAKCCYKCNRSRPQTQFSQMFKHQMSQILFNQSDYSTQQHYEWIRNYMIHILLNLDNFSWNELKYWMPRSNITGKCTGFQDFFQEAFHQLFRDLKR